MRSRGQAAEVEWKDATNIRENLEFVIVREQNILAHIDAHFCFFMSALVLLHAMHRSVFELVCTFVGATYSLADAPTAQDVA